MGGGVDFYWLIFWCVPAGSHVTICRCSHTGGARACVRRGGARGGKRCRRTYSRDYGSGVEERNAILSGKDRRRSIGLYTAPPGKKRKKQKTHNNLLSNNVY